MPKVSVIVPIYNVEPYLKKCVDSVLNQSFDDYELILVDDGSPDNCGAMCDEYAKRDHRVKVIHKINGGLSDARNAGLDVAKGEFVCFIDSDDWVDKDLLKDNVLALEKSGADLSIFGYKEVYHDHVVKKKLTPPSSKSMDEKSYFFHKIPVVVWAKFYRLSLWQNLRFPVGLRHEDDYTHPYIIASAQNIVSLDKLYYFYNQTNQSSIMRTSSYIEDRYIYFLCAMQFIKCTENNKNESYIGAIRKAYSYAFEAWNWNLVTKILTDKQLQEIENFIEKYSKDAPLLPFHQRKYLWGYKYFRLLNRIKGYLKIRKYNKSMKTKLKS